MRGIVSRLGQIGVCDYEIRRHVITSCAVQRVRIPTRRLRTC